MRPADYAKAILIGMLALGLDLAAATAAIFVYSMMIEPGRSVEYYTAVAPGIAAWSTRIAGPLLLGGLVYAFSRRRPDRDVWVFALVVWFAYFVLDGAAVGYRGYFAPVVLMTLMSKLAGALAGGALASATAPRASEDGRR